MTTRHKLLLLPLLVGLLASAGQAQPFLGLGENAGQLVVRLIDESRLFVEDVGSGKPEVRILGTVERTENGAKQRAHVQELGLDVEVDYIFQPGRAEVSGRVHDVTGKDRAVIVRFVLPIDAKGWTWWDDIRASRLIEEGAYHNWLRHGEGGGQHSIYPFSCITKPGQAGLCLGIPLDRPIIHRLSYDADKKRYEVAFDLGLSPKTSRFSSAAAFRLIVFDTEPEWGFRAAAAKYYGIYFNSFWCRSKTQGIWMPFTKISKIDRAEDFGFGYQEGASDVAYDDAHNILSFVYVEPWSLRFYLPPDVKKAPSPKEALQHPAVKEKQAKKIEIAKTCGIYTKDGTYATRMYTADWARGKTVYDFLVSADPDVPGKVTKAKVMDERVFGRFEKEAEKGNVLDGVYFDGFGEWRRPQENYRQDLWKTTNYPLTFSWATKKPVQMTCFTVYEYVAYLAGKLKRKKHYLMANGFMYGFPFMAHYLDVGGNEIHWMKHTGADDAYLDLRRTMAYQKPYLPLNNEDFTVFKNREVEKYFTKCLYYGFLPSMFSPGASGHNNFWNTPEFHNRERHLFKRYTPITIKVAEAGWEPIPHTWSDDPKVRVERFGRGLERNVHITAYNDSDEARDLDIRIDTKALEIDNRDSLVYDLVSAQMLEAKDDWGKLRVRGALPPRGVAVLWLTSRDLAAGHYVAMAMEKIDILVDRWGNSKLPDTEKKAITGELRDVAKHLRMSPFSAKSVAAQTHRVRRLCLNKVPHAPGLRTDLEDVGLPLSAAEMILSGVRLEAAGDRTAPAGRTARIVLRVHNQSEVALGDVTLTLITQTGDKVQPIGTATAEAVAPRSTREFPLDIAVPKDAPLGSYMPLLTMMEADRDARPFVLCVRSSVVVSPLCDVRVERCEDEPRFLVTVQNNARGTTQGTIRPKPAAHWTAQPAEQEISVKGGEAASFSFAMVPPKDAKVGMVPTTWEIAIDGAPEPIRCDVPFCYAPPEKNLLKNAGFEQGQADWQPYEKGCAVVGGGRKGGSCLHCENPYPIEARGAVQEVLLKQQKTTPLLLSAWSKADGVSGGSNRDYAIYVDIKYTDGTSLYGQTVRFRTGTHDWEYAEGLIETAKPIDSLRVYALFRRHAGKAWFDDIRLCEIGK